MEIVKAPNGILKKKTEEVKNCGDVKPIVTEIKEFFKKNPAAGLAAPQLGKSFRVFLINSLGEEPSVYINPMFFAGKYPVENVEGCLSIPGKTFRVIRFKDIQVVYQDMSGRKIRKRFYGQEAFVFQHELDHLNGILISDKEVKKQDEKPKQS